MAALLQADDRDVIVRRKSPGTFTIGLKAGTPQVACGSLGEALLRAAGFAVEQNVRLWYTTDGRAYSPLPEVARLRRNLERIRRDAGPPPDKAAGAAAVRGRRRNQRDAAVDPREIAVSRTRTGRPVPAASPVRPARRDGVEWPRRRWARATVPVFSGTPAETGFPYRRWLSRPSRRRHPIHQAPARRLPPARWRAAAAASPGEWLRASGLPGPPRDGGPSTARRAA